MGIFCCAIKFWESLNWLPILLKGPYLTFFIPTAVKASAVSLKCPCVVHWKQANFLNGFRSADESPLTTCSFLLWLWKRSSFLKKCFRHHLDSSKIQEVHVQKCRNIWPRRKSLSTHNHWDTGSTWNALSNLETVDFFFFLSSFFAKNRKKRQTC